MNWENIIKEDSRFERYKNKIRRRKQRALERRRLKGKAVRGQEKRDMSYFLKRVDELKKTIKDLQTMSKNFDAEKRESMNRTIKGLEKEIEKIMSIALDDTDTFEKEAGGVSFGGHGANPALFNISYGGGKRGKKRRKEKVRD
tara:strand:- start:1353 stop:1781 length:429 start_codon:yes stop_codon:yes gene_type:complete